MMKSEKGQSLVEVVFSVGIMVIIIAGVVSLMAKTISLKTAAAQRKKAADMAELVIENILEQKKNDATGFWNLTDITTPQTVSGYDGFSYVIDYERFSGNGCSATVVECANADITVSWGDNQNITVKRFFSKKM